MATGQEHYLEAERLIADAINPRTDSPYDDDSTAGVGNTIAAAQVHATLAQAAADARMGLPRTWTDHDGGGGVYDMSRRYVDSDGDVWELSGWLIGLEGPPVAVMACTSANSQEKFSELAHVPFSSVVGEYGPLTELAARADDEAAA